MENLAFKNLLYEPLKRAIEVIKVLTSTTVLKIHYRSYFKYFIIKDVVRHFAKNFKVELGIELKTKGPSSSSISLSIKEEVWDVRVTKGITKAHSLQ